MTYTLSTTPNPGTIDDEPGMAQYALSDSAHGKTICYMYLPMQDADFWSRLLNAQAEKAWAEGWEHYRINFSPVSCPDFGVNPYTTQEKEQPS